MSIAWLAPAALFGAVLIVLPIAVHLLVRQHARVQAFPSLRFLRETQLAALRRRRIEDAALLVCRIGIIAAAIGALAGPLLMTSARTAAHAGRTSRAIVLTGVDTEVAAQGADEGAFRSVTITRMNVADAIADAMRWLEQQPPSAREIVVTGALSRGVVTEGELAAIPAEVGVRFIRSGSPSPPDITVPFLVRRNLALTRVERSVHLDSDSTRVVDGAATAVPDDLVTIVASASDTPLATAALHAALDGGIPWADFERRVRIAWDGADEAAVGAADVRVIRMPRPAPDAAAADAVRDVLATASRPKRVDPDPIPDQQLKAWSRPAGPPLTTAPLSDEGDRRWLWALALTLLGLESWLRWRRSTTGAVAAEPTSEVRVA